MLKQFYNLPNRKTDIESHSFLFVVLFSCSYSMEQIFTVVADVERYPEFVPWCTKATIFHRLPNHFKAKLQIGFPPLIEQYTSVVTLAKPHLVKVCLYSIILI